MAIISSYPTITPTSSDLVLIVDTSEDGNPTKTASAQSIANLANSTSQYTAYATRLNASSSVGGATPTVNLLANNTGLTFTWARNGVGLYDATITGGIAPEQKVWFTAGSGGGNDYQKLSFGSETELTLNNFDGTTGAAVEGLNEVYIEIRIYS
jgi:hypothetical protein